MQDIFLVFIYYSYTWILLFKPQVHFSILPNGTYQLKYNLVPLMPGNLILPRLQLNMTRYPDLLASIVQKMLPTDIFVQVIVLYCFKFFGSIWPFSNLQLLPFVFGSTFYSLLVYLWLEYFLSYTVECRSSSCGLEAFMSSAFAYALWTVLCLVSK